MRTFPPIKIQIAKFALGDTLKAPLHQKSPWWQMCALLLRKARKENAAADAS
jgi:hypothetical protein